MIKWEGSYPLGKRGFRVRREAAQAEASDSRGELRSLEDRRERGMNFSA